MADIFISYSRKTETELVDRLQEALSSRDVSCWVDREDIFPSSPWRSEIDEAILQSHAFVFVISPESVSSPYCRAELDRAIALGKRLVPVFARDTPAESVPPELAALQFISFAGIPAGDEAGFDKPLGQLVEALSTDVETVHFHTRLLTQAERWAQKSNDRSLLLRGRELTEAERWLDEQISSGRPVLPQQQRLVRDSRQAAIRRQRGSVTVALAISALMALLAVLTALEWRVAVSQRRQAVSQRDRASSLYVAQEAQGQLPSDPQLALVLALRAYDFSPTVQAESSVRAAVAQSSLYAALPAVGGESQWPFDSRGEWAVSSEAGDNGVAVIKVWGPSRRSGTGSPSRPFTLRLPHSYVTSAQFSPDGKQVLAVVTRFSSGTVQVGSWDWAGKGTGFKVMADVASKAVLNRQGSLVAAVAANGEVDLENARGGRVVHTLAPVAGLGGVESLTFSPDGTLVAALGADKTEVWGVGGNTVATFDVGGSGPVAFSPDDSRLAMGRNGPEVDVVNLSAPNSPPLVHALSLPSNRGAHCCDVDQATGLAWNPDGSVLAAATEDTVIWLWAGAATTPVYLQYGTEGQGSTVAFSPNGQLLLDGTLVWDWQATLDRYLNGQYDDIAFSPKGDVLAAASQDGGIVLWDWRTFTSRWLAVPPVHPTAPAGLLGYSGLTFSPDGAYAAAGTGTSVTVWRVAGSTPVAKLALPHGSDWGGAKAIEFAPGGRALVIDAEAAVGPKAHDVVLYWRWQAHQSPGRLVLAGSYGYLAGFAGPSARVLSTTAVPGGPSRLLAWDGATSATARLVATVPQRDGWSEAAVLPDDKLLLADEAGVAVFNLKTRHFGAEIKDYELKFVLSPSGELVAMPTESGQVEVWDLKSRDAPLVAFTSQGQPFPAAVWGASGSVLAVADPVDGAKVMPAVSFLPFNQLLPIARRLSVTTLTKTEIREFLP